MRPLNDISNYVELYNPSAATARRTGERRAAEPDSRKNHSFTKHTLRYNQRCHWGMYVPILREGELDIISHSAEQTRRLGVRLGTLLQAGDIICLAGDLGAGKTAFASGIGEGWGATQPLTSPTFNLVHEHERERDAQILFHLDCYRLHSPASAETIGIDDILDGRGPVIIEWPEHIDAVLPPERLWIELRIIEPTRRNFIFEASGKRYETLLEHFRDASFGVNK